VSQEDHAKHGHEVVAGGELGVGAQVIGRFPQVSFELLDIPEGVYPSVHQCPPNSDCNCIIIAETISAPYSVYFCSRISAPMLLLEAPSAEVREETGSWPLIFSILSTYSM
jgi:hypothetical protein